jgi:hypothetical protein
MRVSENHLIRAEQAFQRREWESSNAQLRAFLEALFDTVADIRLNSTKKGGAARKELQDRGVLTKRDGALVQSFIGVAGSSGAHAGSSSEDEATGRFLGAIGIAYTGLSLVPELTRVEDVVRNNLKAPKGGRLPTDSEIKTLCPTCGSEQTLAQASIGRDGSDTVSYCTQGCQAVVVVSITGSSPWPGRGYRLGSHVIRNARDMTLPITDAGQSVLLPASPAALMKKKPASS